MSIVEAALFQICADIRDYQSKSAERQFQILQTAYTMLGRAFLEALTDIQRSPEELIVRETPTFVSIEFKEAKQILFRSKEKPAGLECVCELSWGRKTNQSNELMCKHEAAYLLWKYCFPQYSHYSTRLIDRNQDPNQFAITELLCKVPSQGHS